MTFTTCLFGMLSDNVALKEINILQNVNSKTSPNITVKSLHSFQIQWFPCSNVSNPHWSMHDFPPEKCLDSTLKIVEQTKTQVINNVSSIKSHTQAYTQI
jgi:hypothetical protein